MPSRISLKDMLNIARDIVDGCVFLEQHHYIHRDLAARNCLVACRNGKICNVKIGKKNVELGKKVEATK